MKKLILSSLCMLLFHAGMSQCGNLVITGVVDGDLTSGLPKGVEVYAVCDIADLSLYGLGSANNGGGTDGQEFTFPAISVTGGTYLYVASEAPGFTSFFGFAPNYTSASMAINGDDAIELFCSGAGEDVFGDINTDGTGQPWEYMDGWAYRNANTGPDGSAFTLGSWTFSGPNALDTETSNSTATTPVPIGTYSRVCSGTDINFTSSTGTATEDGVSFVITASTPVIGAQTADIAITGGSAPGADYGFITTTLDFSASTTSTATITINDNGAIDCDRTVVFSLQNPQNGATFGGIATFTLTITDDEVGTGISLLPGDLVFSGYDNSVGGGAPDFISVTTLVDLPPGTSFTLANAVYESGAAANERTNLWYACFDPADASVSSQLITYRGCSGGTLSKGTTISFRLPGTGVANNFLLNGVSSTDFNVANNGNGGFVNFSTSSPDAIFLMQGTWTFNALDATFDGRVLGGIQEGGTWYQFNEVVTPGTRRSRIHPDIECLAIQGSTSPSSYAASYTSTELHTGDQYDLLVEIKDFANTWTVQAAPNNTLNLPVLDYSTPFTVNAASTPGLWRGDANTNFFDCNNWDNFAVATESDDVLIPASPTNLLNVDATAAFSDRFNDTATIKNLTIAGSEAQILNNGDVLIVNGNFVLSGGVLNMNGATAADGKLDLLGNWDNQQGETAFLQGQSTVELRGTADQNINPSVVGPEGFHSLTINKTAGEVILNQNVMVDQGAGNTGVLTLVQGLVDANGNILSVQNSNANAVVRDASTTPDDDSYLYGGTLARRVSTGAAVSYEFPVGGNSLGANRFQLATTSLDPSLVFAGAGTDSISVSFTGPSSGTIATNANENGLVYGELLDAGYWTMEGSNSFSGGEYDAAFDLRGSTNAGGGNYVIMKRPTSGANWDIQGVLGAGPVEGAGVVTASRMDYATFSDFAIAKSTASFPVEWLNFDGALEGSAIRLHWATAQELNNDHFIVERSLDGQAFESIGQVAGGGSRSTSQAYSFLDIEPLAGWNHYRIRQVDLDGAFDWSETIAIEWQLASRLGLAGLYPNPAQNQVTLKLNLPAAGEVKLAVYSPTGSLALVETQTVRQGVQTLGLNLENLAEGMYFLEVSFQGQLQRKSFVIQR